MVKQLLKNVTNILGLFTTSLSRQWANRSRQRWLRGTIKSAEPFSLGAFLQLVSNLIEFVVRDLP